MQTWLMIFHGDPADGGVPIGVVNDGEICLAAVRSAWAAFRQVYATERADPILREGVEGMDRRLCAAAAELERGTSATATSTARERSRTPLAKAFCARTGCGQPLPPTPRQRGSARKFCSPRCRTRDWRERRLTGPRRARVVPLAHDDQRPDAGAS